MTASEVSEEAGTVPGEVPEMAGVEPQADCRGVAAVQGSGDIVAVELGSGAAAEVQVISEEVGEGVEVVVVVPVD